VSDDQNGPIISANQNLLANAFRANYSFCGLRNAGPRSSRRRRAARYGGGRNARRQRDGCPMSPPIAIVVGAGGGLGHAVVDSLVDSGYAVVAVDRNEDKLGELPDGVHREVADATDPASAELVIDRIAREVGVPDVLVNTLGAFIPGPAVETTRDQLQTLLDVNLGAALWLSKAVAPHMSRRRSGAILHVSARPGLDPTDGMAAYSASKAALIHLTRVLDVELRPMGIRVNCIAPQLIATQRNREGLPEDMLSHAVAPEAIAGIIAFLVSDAASPISGAIVPAYG
jgi:NAD(P)-dependent dehydrogenase (short-subunit alcohol dehydrogenase family)